MKMNISAEFLICISVQLIESTEIIKFLKYCVYQSLRNRKRSQNCNRFQPNPENFMNYWRKYFRYHYVQCARYELYLIHIFLYQGRIHDSLLILENTCQRKLYLAYLEYFSVMLLLRLHWSEVLIDQPFNG